jgi:hypothetical protein
VTVGTSSPNDELVSVVLIFVLYYQRVTSLNFYMCLINIE